MRFFITILFTVLVSFVKANIYYVSPTGSDVSAGTIGSPKFNLNSVWPSVSAGDTVYMRGGTYTYTVQQYLTGKNGTSGNMIKIWAYPGESPVITRGASFNKSAGWHRGMVFLTGNYIHVKGIRFTGMYTDDNQVDAGLQCWDVNNCMFERLECDNNVQGMTIENSCTGNLVTNSDFHDNYSNYGGTNGGNSDGLQSLYMTSTSSSNTFRGCRAWNNGDDGFDTFENSGYVLIDSCWAWHNGYNKGSNTAAGDGVGFKLGSDFLTTPANVGVVKRRLQRSMAWDNRNAGVHINEADHSTEIYNNTFFRNVNTGLNFHYNNRVHYFRNNVSLSNGNRQVEVSSASSSLTNSTDNGYNDGSWSTNASSADFVSTDTSGQRGARQANGTLPVRTFLTLSAGSDLIDAGTNVSLGFSGSAPDRGANEYSSGGNVSPVANAGPDQVVTSPVSSVTLSGSGSDADGSISSYLWSLISGSGITIVSPASTSTVINGLAPGTYVFRLTVTDNNGATATDDVAVTVNQTLINNRRLNIGRRLIFNQ